MDNEDTSSKNNLNPQDQLNYKNKAKNLEFVKNNSNIKIPYFKEIISDDFENINLLNKMFSLINDGYDLIIPRRYVKNGEFINAKFYKKRNRCFINIYCP